MFANLWNDWKLAEEKEKSLCDLIPCPVVFVCVVHDSTLGGRKLKTQGYVQTTTH